MEDACFQLEAIVLERGPGGPFGIARRLEVGIAEPVWHGTRALELHVALLAIGDAGDGADAGKDGGMLTEGAGESGGGGPDGIGSVGGGASLGLEEGGVVGGGGAETVEAEPGGQRPVFRDGSFGLEVDSDDADIGFGNHVIMNFGGCVGIGGTGAEAILDIPLSARGLESEGELGLGDGWLEGGIEACGAGVGDGFHIPAAVEDVLGARHAHGILARAEAPGIAHIVIGPVVVEVDGEGRLGILVTKAGFAGAGGIGIHAKARVEDIGILAEAEGGGEAGVGFGGLPEGELGCGMKGLVGIVVAIGGEVIIGPPLCGIGEFGEASAVGVLILAGLHP